MYPSFFIACLIYDIFLFSNYMYQIAIPSLSRSQLLKRQTLKTLEHHNIPNSQITIFCIDKEYDQYKTISDYKIVVGELGLIKQKEFIQTYYPVNTNILFLDDDIQEIDLDNFNSLDELIVTGFNECRNKNSYIWSIYPVWNKFFRQTKSYLSTSLKFCIGGFTGIINRKINPKITCFHREDVERSIKYFMRDGIVLRFNRVGYKTKFFKTKCLFPGAPCEQRHQPVRHTGLSCGCGRRNGRRGLL